MWRLDHVEFSGSPDSSNSGFESSVTFLEERRGMLFCCLWQRWILGTEKGLAKSSQFRRMLSGVVGRLPNGSGVWPSALRLTIGIGQLLPLSGWGKSAPP